MRFLVRIEAEVPADLTGLDALNAAETARGVELLRSGVIEQIWRVEGRRANVGIWVADSRDALDALIDSLPMRRFLVIAQVEVLMPHPVTGAAENG